MKEKGGKSPGRKNFREYEWFVKENFTEIFSEGFSNNPCKILCLRKKMYLEHRIFCK